MKKYIVFTMLMILIGVCGIMNGCKDPDKLPDMEDGKRLLVKDEMSKYKIVISDKAEGAEITAANELKKYIKSMSGCNMKITNDTTEQGKYEIVIGRTARSEAYEGFDWEWMGEEGYTIRWKDDMLVIAGGSGRGTLYAVYGFLEALGCRFFAPDCETIPSLETIRIETDFNDRQRPAFSFRDVFWACAFDEAWSVKQRVNSCFNLFNRTLGRSISPEWGGGISNAGPQHVHNFEMLVPVQEYFDSHPEYFSEINGKRTSKFLYSQLCLTNEDVLEIVVNKIRDWLRENPESRVVPISQNDSYVIESYCTCKECKKINRQERSNAGTLIRFVNLVAESLKEEFPNVIFETLAYQFSALPPRNIKPADNVVVRYCISSCAPHALTECPANASARTNIEKWLDAGYRLYVWDYTTNFAQYLCPMPNMERLQKNAQYFYESGIIGVFEQGNYQDPVSGEFGMLRSYLLAKLLWDPYTDIETHKQEFLNAYYGAGGDKVGAYLDILHKIVLENNRDFNLVSNAADIFKGLISDEMLEQMDRLWEEAISAVKKDETALLHVQRSELQFRYYKMMSKRGEFSDADTYENMVSDFTRDCGKRGISYFNEGNPIPWNN